MRRPDWLVPETIQTSVMDCGPACLASLLKGFGAAVSYARLREVCQTSLDGTSIDRLEEIAVSLGAQAEQTVVAADQLMTRAGFGTPAIAVTVGLDGATHFIVLWRRIGPLYQVMDPRVGRRWLTGERLARELYRHTVSLPAEVWRAWAGTAGFLDPLTERLRQLGVPDSVVRSWLAQACGDSGWTTLATLDAAVRMGTDLLAHRAVRRGGPACKLVEALWRHALEHGLDAAIPNPYRAVQPDLDDPSRLWLSGAVLLFVQEVAESPAESQCEPELRPVLQDDKPMALRQILARLHGQEAGRLSALAAVLVASALFALVEGLALRGFMHLTEGLRLIEQRLSFGAVLVGLFSVLLAVEFLLQAEILRVGRGFDLSLRVDYLRGIRQTGLRYFRSRPVSDLCQRFHIGHILRTLPSLLAQILRQVATLLAIGASLVWLAPDSAGTVVLMLILAVAVPLLMQGAIGEYDLRFRTHTGALGQYYLDALLGADAVRAHGAGSNLMNAHETLLVEWKRTGLQLLKLSVIVVAVDLLFGFGLTGLFLHQHLGAESNASALLLVFWAFGLPALGQTLAQSLRQYPTLKNVLIRLLEPVRHDDAKAAMQFDSKPSSYGRGQGEGRRVAANSEVQDLTLGPALTPTPLPQERGFAEQHWAAPSLRWSGVSVRAGGNTVLDGIDLDIPASSHVAVVGRSGAGKSSLIGSLMGWHRPSTGGIEVDGEALDGERLRSRCVWVDPSVALWNTTLLDNLLYGNAGAADLQTAMADAALHAVLRRLDEGLQTRLGESGGRLSGGEGQRVRLARGLLRKPADLVLLDEALRGLDGELRDALLPRLREVWRHATLLHVTHRIHEALAFPRVLVIEDGCIVEDGRPEVLLNQAGSRFRVMLEADVRARGELWQAYGFKTWTLDFNGHLTVDDEPPTVVTSLRGPLRERLGTRSLPGHAPVVAEETMPRRTANTSVPA